VPIDAKEHAAELLEECRHPLGSSSILAASPDYTAAVFRAALELAYELGEEGAKLPEPRKFREGVSRLIAAHQGTVTGPVTLRDGPVEIPVTEEMLGFRGASQAVCTQCGRKTWDAVLIGLTCGMSQPDGTKCEGRFYTEEMARVSGRRP